VKRNPVPAMAVAAIGLAVAGVVALQLWMAERARAGVAFGDQARTALNAALDLRRAGANARMRSYLGPLEKAYKELEGRRLAEVEYLMGRMHRALNDDVRALEFQERALECDPEFAPALYERTLLRVRRWLAAADVDGDLDLRRIPPDVMAELDAALAEVRESKALSAAERATAEGLRCLLDPQRGSASEAFRRASTSDPQLEEAREGLGAALRLESLSQAGRKEAAWADAETLYTKGIEKDKGYVAHYMARGQLRWSRGSARRHRGLDPMPDYTAAEADFAKATELAPAHVDAWTWRGEMKVYQGIYALEMGWDPRPRLDAAEVDFAKALEINPKWARAWMWRGNGRFYRGLWMAEKGLDARDTLEAAEKDLGESIARAQNANHERRWRGRIRALRGTSIALAGGDPAAVWASAEDDFRKGEERDAWHHTWWAGLERARGDLAQAEARLTKALEINASFDEALKLRGLVRWDRRDYAGAASDLHQALAINPNFQPSIGDLLDRARRKSSE
jgi:tetratricopeptide (TPR) repeat protein